MNYITESAGRKSYIDHSERAKDYPEEPRNSNYIIEREGILRNDAPRESYNPRRNSRDTLRNEEPMSEHYLRKEHTPYSNPIISAHMKFDSKSDLGWYKTHFILAIDSGGTLLP
jgi:hypothetical protein